MSVEFATVFLKLDYIYACLQPPIAATVPAIGILFESVSLFRWMWFCVNIITHTPQQNAMRSAAYYIEIDGLRQIAIIFA